MGVDDDERADESTPRLTALPPPAVLRAALRAYQPTAGEPDIDSAVRAAMRELGLDESAELELDGELDSSTPWPQFRVVVTRAAPANIMPATVELVVDMTDQTPGTLAALMVTFVKTCRARPRASNVSAVIAGRRL